MTKQIRQMESINFNSDGTVTVIYKNPNAEYKALAAQIKKGY